jgi:thiol-disulfide isomerase/thioredoxin
MSKKLSLIASIVLSLCIGFIIFNVFLKDKYAVNNSSKQMQTQALFAAKLIDTNDKVQALKQWQGKLIVLNFWATWCPPCREEMPELSELNKEYQNKNVVVVGIAIDEAGLVKTFRKENNISYPLLSAENEGMELATGLGNDKGVLPYTVIILPDGSVAKTFFGRISKPLLEETLSKIM